jgi:hypothetical protein
MRSAFIRTTSTGLVFNRRMPMGTYGRRKKVLRKTSTFFPSTNADSYQRIVPLSFSFEHWQHTERLNHVFRFSSSSIHCMFVFSKILREIVSEQRKYCYVNYVTATLCFLGAGAIVFFGMPTSSNPSLNVDSAFSGITSSGNDNCL